MYKAYYTRTEHFLTFLFTVQQLTYMAIKVYISGLYYTTSDRKSKNAQEKRQQEQIVKNESTTS